MLTRESLAALVAERDRCSDGRSAYRGPSPLKGGWNDVH